MKYQTLKSLAITLVTLLVVCAGSVASANAQSNQHIYAQIPFNFVVGGKTLSAGQYSISSAMMDGSALVVRNVKAKGSAIRLSAPIQSQSRQRQTRLVFHRYGETYFLAEVWQSGNSTGRVLHASKAERALQRERALIAQNSYETVELIASAR
ncbi:MAG TPA: hypothetical protein VGW58_10840 [Pyrinomonadaceae bacterium]|nr:hypothetical protein [Pyrinomonadaceae bacterium]